MIKRLFYIKRGFKKLYKATIKPIIVSDKSKVNKTKSLRMRGTFNYYDRWVQCSDYSIKMLKRKTLTSI